MVKHSTTNTLASIVQLSSSQLEWIHVLNLLIFLYPPLWIRAIRQAELACFPNNLNASLIVRFSFQARSIKFGYIASLGLTT